MSQMEPTSAGPAWMVVDNQPAQGRSVTGAYGAGHLVTIKLDSGSTGQVFISNADYGNEAKVRAALEAKAADVHRVDQMSSQKG